MSEAEAHGTAIVCERDSDGHTVAYVDAQQSRHVPVGYFTETWLAHGHEDYTCFGTLDGGYITMPIVAGLRHPSTEYAICRDWYDAVLWCRGDARRRQARKQLITYGMLGAMVRHWKEGEAG